MLSGFKEDIKFIKKLYSDDSSTPKLSMRKMFWNQKKDIFPAQLFNGFKKVAQKSKLFCSNLDSVNLFES